MSEREAGVSRFGWLGSWAGGAPVVLGVRAGASAFAREGKRTSLMAYEYGRFESSARCKALNANAGNLKLNTLD